MLNININEVKRLNLIRLMVEKSLKPVDLADLLQVRQPYISALLKKTGKRGSRNVGPKTIKKISAKLNIEESEFFRYDVVGLSVSKGRYGPIPVISWVDAGKLNEAIEPWPDGVSGVCEPIYSHLKGCAPNVFGLEVRGDSMETRYKEGDIIIVDPSEQYCSGDPCVVWLNGEVMFKVFKENDVEIRLEPLNNKYETRVMLKDSNVDFKIIGKVVDMVPKL